MIMGGFLPGRNPASLAIADKPTGRRAVHRGPHLTPREVLPRPYVGFLFLAKRGCASGKALRGEPVALSAAQRSEGSWAEAPCHALRADALSLGQAVASVRCPVGSAACRTLISMS